jgi:hypothetical protein
MKRKNVAIGTPDCMEHWWELRIVDASQIDAIEVGEKQPPPMPAVWQKALFTFRFDKSLLSR